LKKLQGAKWIEKSFIAVAPNLGRLGSEAASSAERQLHVKAAFETLLERMGMAVRPPETPRNPNARFQHLMTAVWVPLFPYRTAEKKGAEQPYIGLCFDINGNWRASFTILCGTKRGYPKIVSEALDLTVDEIALVVKELPRAVREISTKLNKREATAKTTLKALEQSLSLLNATEPSAPRFP
jgi:hypothetical protein